jgi:hypothetical protein
MLVSGQGPMVENARAYPFVFLLWLERKGQDYDFSLGHAGTRVGSAVAHGELLGNEDSSCMWSVLAPGGS